MRDSLDTQQPIHSIVGADWKTAAIGLVRRFQDISMSKRNHMHSFQDFRMSMIANIASTVVAVSSHQFIFEWIIILTER
jgi:hypothetical protein